MKLQGPTPNGQVSHGGMIFQCDSAGILEVPRGNDALARVLTETHGFTVVKEEPAPAPPPAPAPAAKVAQATTLKKVEDDPPPKEPAPIPAIDAEKATRDEMKDWLKGLGVEFAGNASNDALRDMVRAELEARKPKE